MQNDKFQNKYRVSSARLPNWDYGSNGAYFITICTKNREHFFGKILNGKMGLNELGQIANSHWMEIPNRFSFVELGNFELMPNHVHGILIIDKTNDNDVDADAGDVETRLIASLHHPHPPKTGGFAGNKNPMMHNNISRIIRWYKGRCAFEMRKINMNFAWQPRFHDHIIRNRKSFDTISEYITNNPAN